MIRFFMEICSLRSFFRQITTNFCDFCVARQSLSPLNFFLSP